jgi:excisionase family DNA binding protein
MSVPKAARYLSCDVATLRAMIREGKFPVVQIGKQLRVDQVKLKKWLENGGR